MTTISPETLALDLDLEKTATLAAVLPGERITHMLTSSNSGDVIGTEAVANDPPEVGSGLVAKAAGRRAARPSAHAVR